MKDINGDSFDIEALTARLRDKAQEPEHMEKLRLLNEREIEKELMRVRERRHETMTRAGIPGFFIWLMESGDYDADTPALRAVNETRAQQDIMTLMLMGANGVGKTVASAAWMMQCIEATGRVVDSWYSAQDLCALSSYDAKNDLQRLQKTPCLVIQDLGAEIAQGSGDDRWRAVFLNLLETRKLDCFQTCITSNLSMPELKLRYGTRIMERFKQWTAIFDIKGRNFRNKRMSDVVRRISVAKEVQ